FYESSYLLSFPTRRSSALLKVNNPILTNTDLLKIRYAKIHNIVTKDVPITYYKGTSLEKAIQHLCIAVDQAHKNGATVVILTDRSEEHTSELQSRFDLVCR